VKEKILILIMTLVMILTAITIPIDINVEANDDDNDPGIDHSYIYKKTKKLSEFFDDNNKWRSREFGTIGEIQAANDIEGWMKNLSLYNSHQETIDAIWSDEDTWDFDKDNYVGDLNEKREFDNEDYFLNIVVYDKQNRYIIGKNFDYTNCFPFLKGWYGGETQLEPTSVRVFRKYHYLYDGDQVIYFQINQWSPQPYRWYWKILLPYMTQLKCKGFIVSDKFSDTWFMAPSHKDHFKFNNPLKVCFIKPGFSINGSDGNWLEYYLNRPNIYNVFATVKSKWKLEQVTSYNVIGQINGTDTGNISICVAHLDSWWSQGAIDEGAETALVLGIAKYMKDKNLTLKHTVKFIATAGEEMGYRGIKDYIKDNIIKGDENVLYVINPGNFGHEDRFGQDGKILKFEFASKEGLNSLAGDIAKSLKFKDRTNIPILKLKEVPAEDSKVFALTGNAESSIAFSRFPYKMYHRGGKDIDFGDTMDILDNSSFQVESEIVASVALHCTVDSEHRIENVSFVPYDSDNNGNNDSVKIWYNLTTDTNTTLFGRAKGFIYPDQESLSIITKAESDLAMLKKNNISAGCLNLQLPSKESSGEYSVRFTVVDYWNESDDEYSETVNLYPYSKPKSNFDTQITSLKTRTFTDNSTPSPSGTIVSWNWSFGDGNYSNQQNTSHTYYDDGNYTVSLTIWDSNNLSNTSNMTLFVDNAVPTVLIDVLSNIQIAGDSISFNTSSSDSDGSITNYTWDFGDDTTDYTAAPSHNYLKSGLYTVNLTVTDDDGYTNFTTKTMIVAGALADDSYQQDDPQNHTWDTVQEAINDVNDDDIIFVYNGNYAESITINRSIYLLGQDKNQVTIQSMSTVIDIVNESVEMEGFTVKNGNTAVQINSVNNCSIINCDIKDSINGIKITSGAENNTISKCNFTGNSYGLFISGSLNWIGSRNMNQLYNDSYFNNNRYGIYVDNSYSNMIIGCNIDATPPQTGGPPLASYGVCLDDSENNSIYCNNIYKAGKNGYGVYLDDSTDNSICHNLIEENDYGVFLTSSSDNRVAMNNISYNVLSGVTIIMMSSSNNYIYWNDLLLNGLFIYPQAYDDGSNNYWNSSGNETLNYISAGEGNYWSDYTGVDNDGDGIGDTSYLISGIAGAADSYPVMKANNYQYS
jgi:parallel beta-helix repeat protein